MRRMRKPLLLAARSAACILLMLVVAACVAPLSPEERLDQGRDLPIRIYMPYGKPKVTKASDDNLVLGTQSESTLYNIQIWAFHHCEAGDEAADDQRSVAYCMIDDLRSGSGWRNNEQKPSGYYAHWDTDHILTVHMFLPHSVTAMPDDELRFDFYILANSTSIGFADLSSTTRGTLRSQVFGKSGNDDWFGTSTLVQDVPSTGLPISGFFNTDKEGKHDGVDISFIKEGLSAVAKEDTTNFPVIQLSRAVSKVRFLFSRHTGMDDVTVDDIEITDYTSTTQATDGVIPRASFVFPREDGTFLIPEGTTYDKATFAGTAGAPLLATADIGVSNDPAALRRTDNQTSQQYDYFVQTQLNPTPPAQKTMTQRVLYLRESDKPLKGRIHYTMGGRSYTATFSMEGLASTELRRNHSWTVYAYFSEKEIHFYVDCFPWGSGGHIALTGSVPAGAQ